MFLSMFHTVSKLDHRLKSGVHTLPLPLLSGVFFAIGSSVLDGNSESPILLPPPAPPKKRGSSEFFLLCP